MPLGAAIVCALLASGVVQAAVFPCPSGDVTCLITAITTANGTGEEDTITLEAGTYTLTAAHNMTATLKLSTGTLTAVDTPTAGANGLPPITSTLAITGPGAEATILERQTSAAPFRLFHVTATGQLTIDGLTLRGGLAVERGGAIYNEGGAVTVINSAIVGNAADRFGGGIDNFGTLTITNTTMASNRAGEVAGAIASDSGTLLITHSTLTDNAAERSGGIYHALGTLTVSHSTFTSNLAWDLQGGAIFNDRSLLMMTNSTVALNVAGLHGGGIYNEGGTLRVSNSTVAGNRAEVSGGGLANFEGSVEAINTIAALNTVGLGDGSDCFGSITSQGHNLIGDTAGCTMTLQASDLTAEPGLGAFTADGTPGHGHFPLLPASRAINAGNDEACPEMDQLGQPRVGICDIGTIEFQQCLVLVNDSVTFEPSRSTFHFTPDPTGCPTGPAFVGTFSFLARLTNTSDPVLSDLFVAVTTLTNDNRLQNAEGPPFGVGARLTVPQQDGFTDGVLRPDEVVDVPFLICVTAREPFTFLVDVFGGVETSADARARAALVTDRRARAWTLRPE